jgi:hypothetical protein
MIKQMNYFSKIKVGTWIVIVLTIINLASLTTIIYKTSCDRKEFKRPDNHSAQRQKGRGFHWKQLGLDSLQEVKFREKGKLYFDSVRVIYKLRDSLALKIANELKKDNPDKKVMYQYSRLMGENYGRSKTQIIDHLLELRKLCKPEQVHKLDSMYYFLLVGFENPKRNMPGKKPMADTAKMRNSGH